MSLIARAGETGTTGYVADDQGVCGSLSVEWEALTALKSGDAEAVKLITMRPT
jgi:hypothetical protein